MRLGDPTPRISLSPSTSRRLAGDRAISASHRREDCGDGKSPITRPCRTEMRKYHLHPLKSRFSVLKGQELPKILKKADLSHSNAQKVLFEEGV